MTSRLILPVMTVLALSGCASGQRPAMSERQIDRVLAGKPGAAQPSRVVATEIAYAREARKDGLWDAMREYSAPEAVIHGRGGPANLRAVIAATAEPNPAPQRKTRAVWMSCDGRMAVSQGRFVEADGKVGSYVTAWTQGREQSRDRDYRWTYDVAALDDPQPEVPEESVAGDGEIVVTGIESLKGIVADCPRADIPEMPLAPPRFGNVAATSDQVSPDGTLRWRWIHQTGGERRVVVQLKQSGGMNTVLDETFPPSDDD